MNSNWLNVHIVGSKPLERAKNHALWAGITGSAIGWTFFTSVPYWNTPYLLIISTVTTFLTLILYGLYELPFETMPTTSFGQRLQMGIKRTFPPTFAIISFLIFLNLFLLFHHMMRGRGMPNDSLWFDLSVYIGIPLMGLRKVMGKLYDGESSRRVQVFLQIVRLIGLFAGISLVMSYLNGIFFKPEPGGKVGVGFLLFWTPAILTALAGTVMFFDSVLGVSDKRKHVGENT